MPTYVCVVEAELLNDQQKQRIASAITRLHGETTGADVGNSIRGREQLRWIHGRHEETGARSSNQAVTLPARYQHFI
jgi:hypothetical protein